MNQMWPPVICTQTQVAMRRLGALSTPPPPRPAKTKEQARAVSAQARAASQQARAASQQAAGQQTAGGQSLKRSADQSEVESPPKKTKKKKKKPAPPYPGEFPA